jgi:hypothetical protein
MLKPQGVSGGEPSEWLGRESWRGGTVYDLEYRVKIYVSNHPFIND